jgi:cytochrome c-type biogenesis protein
VNLGVAAAFAAGLASVASPCVLPLLPSYLSHLAGAEVADLRSGVHPRALARAALFVAGFGAVFVALGASASSAGAALRAYQPFLQKLGGLAVVVFGLQLLGVWNFWRFAPPAGRAAPAAAARPSLGSLVLGAAFALCWTPCVGPVLASLLVLAGQSGTALRGAELLAAYAAGLGLPFLAAAVSLGWFLRATSALGPWLPRLERLAGALLVAAGLALYFGDYARLAGLLSA